MTSATEIKEARALWATALRSGKYRQGRQQLRQINDTYCCLGVAHDAFGGLWVQYDAQSFAWAAIFEGCQASTAAIENTVLAARLGLSSGDHLVLTQLNDIYDFSFADIADIVEAADPELDGICRFAFELTKWFDSVPLLQRT